MNIDFDKLDAMDIRELIRNANEALEVYADREKTAVYGISVPFVGWQYYIKRHRAIRYLQELIEDPDTLFQKLAVEIQIKYVNQAELEYCQDYYAEQNPDKYPENY